MNRKVLLLLSLIFLCINNKIIAQSENVFYKIEDVKYNEDISFPYIIPKISGKTEITNNINKGLQTILFGEEEIINQYNIQLIKEQVYIESINQAGITTLNYKFDFHTNFLKITINIDWAGGPYPIGGKTECLQFDLEKGELILMPDLIDGSKYFDFLEKFWLNDCRVSIKEAHQCAYGNETDNYESDSAYTLEGICEFQCHKMNHKFILSNDTIFISNNPNCFPHVWQNCNYGSSKYLKINEIKEYLSDYGKWLLELSDSYKEATPYFHFVGKINDTYKISLSICKSKDDNVKGEYFYWKQNKKIVLTGKISHATQSIYINELVNNAVTGRFELEWDDFLYSTEGFWYDSSNKKKLPVQLLNVYDYSNREYYR